jgi:hypothetical protein
MVNANVLRARAILIVYLAFSVAVLAFGYWSHSRKDLRESLVPITGWIGLSPYMWTLFFSIFALIFTNRTTYMSVVRMLGLVTALDALVTAFDAIMAWLGSPDFGNPYLMYHPVRPLITVVLPSAWILALWRVGCKLPRAQDANRIVGIPEGFERICSKH